MDWMMIIATISRWLHLLSACIVVGGVFGILLTPSTTPRSRAFKPLLHGCFLLLILTGSFNAWRAWGQYSLQPGVLHGVFGMHVLLALAAIGLLIWATIRPSGGVRPMVWGLVLLFVVVLLASTLKGLRERALMQSSTQRMTHA